MKHFYIIILCATFSLSYSFSQSKTEIGIFGGCSALQGDINADRYYKDFSYAFGALYKYDFTHRYVLRAQVNYLNLKAADANSSDPYKQLRNASYGANKLDIALQFEFNFLKFKFSERYHSFSSYICAGIGVHVLGASAGPTLPMGVGIKRTIGRRWCVGAEYQFRKTFSDRLDGIQNIVEPRSIMNNNDWYAMAGITITYKIFDALTDCPAYDEKINKKWR